jgi:ATPase subunit of ABC transporter with duplicated ATPase domains
MSKLNKNELIRLKDVSKWFKGKCILDNISFSICFGDKTTIVGNNGIGKSTLIKILAQKEAIEGGEITFDENISVGYLEQDPLISEDKSIIEYITQDSNVSQLGKDFYQLLITKEEKQVTEDFINTETDFNRQGGFNMYKILSGLKLSQIPVTRNLSSLSGGELTRVSLSKLLFEDPDILLLDEPTNHLDVHALEWLENYLKKKKGTVILITHDRTFLDHITNSLIEIYNSNITFFRGKYLDWLLEKQRKDQLAVKEYYQMRKEENILEDTINKHQKKLDKKHVRTDSDKISHNSQGSSAQKFLGQKIKKNNERISEINEKMDDRHGKLKEFVWELKSNEDHVNKTLCHFENIGKSINHQEILKGCSGDIKYGDKILFDGKNGAGKTSLLNILVGLSSPDSGRVDNLKGIRIGYVSQKHDVLDQNKTVVEVVFKHTKFFEERILSFLYEYCLFDSDIINKPIRELSVGQQRRLQLALTLRINPDLLILDEPTNHLDILSCEYLEKQLLLFPGSLLVVSHDRYFVKKFNFNYKWTLENGILTEKNIFVENKDV